MNGNMFDGGSMGRATTTKGSHWEALKYHNLHRGRSQVAIGPSRAWSHGISGGRRIGQAGPEAPVSETGRDAIIALLAATRANHAEVSDYVATIDPYDEIMPGKDDLYEEALGRAGAALDKVWELEEKLEKPGPWFITPAEESALAEYIAALDDIYSLYKKATNNTARLAAGAVVGLAILAAPLMI